MSTTLRLVHRTGYTYNGPATASYNQARLAPRASSDQTVLHTRLEITPTPWQETWTDYWGTQVTSFELHEPHPELKVVAISTVTVDRKQPTGEGLSWEQFADRSVTDEFHELLTVGERVEPGADFRDAIDEIRENSSTPKQFVEAITALIRRDVEYLRGRTNVYGRAADAWLAKAGVCQDLAHLSIGALRSQGIPARYVSGYVMPDRDAEIGAYLPGEGHAWIEWWDGAWIGYDPANAAAPDDFYIEVARARDYTDVPPLRGIFTGAPGSKMFVTVEISRLA